MSNHCRCHRVAFEPDRYVVVLMGLLALLPMFAMFGSDGIVPSRIARRIAVPKQQCPLTGSTVLVATAPSFA